MKKNSRFVSLAWALVIMVPTLVGLLGCESEDSVLSQGGPIGIPAPTTPRNTWMSLQEALDLNEVSSWQETIASGFEYLPDPVSAAKFPGVFESWNRDSELAFSQELFAADLEFTAQMLSWNFEIPEPVGDLVNWESVEYSVVVQGPGGSSPVEYRGVANLAFRLEGNFWYLEQWEDLHGGTASWNPEIVMATLGELRAVYSVSGH